MPTSASTRPLANRALRLMGTFLTPIMGYFAFTVIGIVTGFVTFCNLCEFAIVGWLLVRTFVALFRKNAPQSFAFLCSAAAIVYLMFFGFNFRNDDIRAYTYDFEIAVVPGFVASCVPPEGIVIKGDLLRVCKVVDFNYHGFDDAIVRITGPASGRAVLADVDSGAVGLEAAEALGRFGLIWPHSLRVRKLLRNYYLVANLI